MYLIYHVISQDSLIQGSCKIYVWELLAVFCHLDKFGDHRHYDSEDIMVLIFHLTSRDHMLKGLYEFISGSHSW